MCLTEVVERVAYRRLRKQNQYNNAAYCYSEPYLRALVDPKKLWIAEYFDTQKLFALPDPFVVSRALSVELLFRQLEAGQSAFATTKARAA